MIVRERKNCSRRFFPEPNTYLIGITGPPGAGKSTLTDKLIALLRQQGKTVGVIAVDPSSPFSGGAIMHWMMEYLFAAWRLAAIWGAGQDHCRCHSPA